MAYKKNVSICYSMLKRKAPLIDFWKAAKPLNCWLLLLPLSLTYAGTNQAQGKDAGNNDSRNSLVNKKKTAAPKLFSDKVCYWSRSFVSAPGQNRMVEQFILYFFSHGRVLAVQSIGTAGSFRSEMSEFDISQSAEWDILKKFRKGKLSPASGIGIGKYKLTSDGKISLELYFDPSKKNRSDYSGMLADNILTLEYAGAYGTSDYMFKAISLHK